MDGGPSKSKPQQHAERLKTMYAAQITQQKMSPAAAQDKLKEDAEEREEHTGSTRDQARIRRHWMKTRIAQEELMAVVEDCQNNGSVVVMGKDAPRKTYKTTENITENRGSYYRDGSTKGVVISKDLAGARVKSALRGLRERLRPSRLFT